MPFISASHVNHCFTQYPIRDITSISTENKVVIGGYYKCLFEGNHRNQPFTEEDDFIETAVQLFPSSQNGHLFSCLEENDNLKQQTTLFYFNYVNCLVRGLIDGSEQYCFYRNNDAISYIDCLQEQTTNKAESVPNEFKEQSVKYAYRVSGTTYETCKSARSSQDFVTCSRQAAEDQSNTAQKDCDIELAQFDLKTVVDEKQKKVIGTGFKCVLNKLNTKELPTVYPALELFYKKSIQTVVNCQRMNSYADDWGFYFEFAKCLED